MQPLRSFSVVLLLGMLPTVSFAEPTLEEKLASLAKAHKGKVSLAVQHLGTGEEILLQADETMPTASLIKLPIMVEVYWQAKEGKLKLDEMLSLTKEEMVQGSGILTEHFSPGTKLSIRDTVRLMIVYSDNTATNMILERIGLPSTNKRMEELKLTNTQINAKVFKGSMTSIDPDRTKKYGLGSTTAKEMVQLLKLIHENKVVDATACTEMIGHLKKCDDKDKFSRLLPATVLIAHKTGSVSNARTDAGILYFKDGPVAICVLSNDNEDKSWKPDNEGNRLCAEVAKTVYEHYLKKK